MQDVIYSIYNTHAIVKTKLNLKSEYRLYSAQGYFGPKKGELYVDRRIQRAMSFSNWSAYEDTVDSLLEKICGLKVLQMDL